MSALLRFWRGDDCERGQAIVLIAAVLLGMLMSVGLAIDAGTLYVARRTAQEAADAGAYAGAVVLYEGDTNYTDALSAATTDVGKNGYTDGGDGGRQKVSVIEPSASPFNNQEYVEVDISVDVRTSLVPRSGLTTVSVHSIAGAVPLNNGYAIMALNKSDTANALYVASGGIVKVQDAGILVNSTSSSAANDSGGTVTISNSSTGTVVAGGATGTWPTLATGQAQQADPFAGYPKPPVPTNVFNSANPPPQPVNNAVTLSPGLYEVALNYAGNTTVTFQTGIYILEAGMNASGNVNFANTAGGIFIFNTLTGYPNSDPPTDTCGAVNISGNALVGNGTTQLSPMTTGPYAGLLFYQDPACTQPFQISGNGSLTVSGTIYVPKGQVVLDGSNASFSGSQIVADTVSVQNGTVSVDFSTSSTAQPKLPRLAQ